ncbi:tRNA lysidine(34) synthetase TilS [Tychonema sp. BBK16]|uniref:tRNA lysidine(34) synthetase TilS n=1 Tax=Tychonema sp. BBK16 TaxID=2699888 RepID=UPI001F252AB2|nr:tRNA lysidine(34) synthetase TilS [Tychonema sp. BBK16]MCF6375535.1 tRNA lysidine(34) synthetase TilS [Tychonema sp. BBK16]
MPNLPNGKWTQLHAQLHRTLLQRKVLPPNQRFLVAVSGGQDSLCLLKLLLDLQSKWSWELAIAHCDHRWRSDSEANANHVASLAKNWGICYYQKTADRIPTTEASARNWRYQSLTEIAIANNYPYIITGHTASDRAETLLYNLIRGSGADGLSALTWVRPLADFRLPILDFGLGNPHENQKSKITLVRPLLEITRSQTGQFCQEQKLPIWEDSTNQDLRYARNRIRSELLPYLETHFNPKTQQALAQTAELLRADVEYLELAATDLLQQAMSEINQGEHINFQLPVKLNRQILQAAPLSLQRRAMRQLLQHILPNAPSFESVEKLTALIVAPNRSQTDPFPSGAIASVEKPWITIRYIAEPPSIR